jgi:hypothetical protein
MIPETELKECVSIIFKYNDLVMQILKITNEMYPYAERQKELNTSLMVLDSKRTQIKMRRYSTQQNLYHKLLAIETCEESDFDVLMKEVLKRRRKILKSTIAAMKYCFSLVSDMRASERAARKEEEEKKVQVKTGVNSKPRVKTIDISTTDEKRYMHIMHKLKSLAVEVCGIIKANKDIVEYVDFVNILNEEAKK